MDRVKAHLHETYGESIRRVILYGSYARGEATKDSDVDVLVLTDPSLKPFEVRKSLSGLLFDMLMDESELVSVIVIPEDYFDQHNLPFMMNVRKEGVAI
ncbi:MAG TPA: nucleotidyltransferase domain-containing protein [Sedimentisphaerales bacterium]|nr:nucleotidyltransferase domain-containing protein [Sedimentisphaerales bacterium]